MQYPHTFWLLIFIWNLYLKDISILNLKANLCPTNKNKNWLCFSNKYGENFDEIVSKKNHRNSISFSYTLKINHHRLKNYIFSSFSTKILWCTPHAHAFNMKALITYITFTICWTKIVMRCTFHQKISIISFVQVSPHEAYQITT